MENLLIKHGPFLFIAITKGQTFKLFKQIQWILDRYLVLIGFKLEAFKRTGIGRLF